MKYSKYKRATEPIMSWERMLWILKNWKENF